MYLFGVHWGGVHAVGCVWRSEESCSLSFYLAVLGTTGQQTWQQAPLPTEPCHWPLYSRRFNGSRLSGNIPRVWGKESRNVEVFSSQVTLLSSLTNILLTQLLQNSMNKPKGSCYLGRSRIKRTGLNSYLSRRILHRTLCSVSQF